MHLIDKNTVRICHRLLFDKLESLIKADAKVKNEEGDFVPEQITDVNMALRDITRYEASIDLMHKMTQNLFNEE